ncbi:DUF6461 domain-containing protein [Streptomyces sp. NPDC088748]|uniref:DUF6461 domain-containing protein n=1 Tax=Streptomyces sp. NPDC088748 TaxID=3365887 RepID=UPI003830E80E
MPDSLAQFRWLEGAGPLDEIFCVSFFRRLGPVEVLSRFGAVAFVEQWMGFEKLRRRVWEYVADTGGGEGGGYVGVVGLGEWSVAIELLGWEAALAEAASDLSRGTEVVTVSRHDYAENTFFYAIDGVIVTGFIPKIPSRRHGSDPERLNPLMLEVGLEPYQEDGDVGNPIAASFALASKITGVAFAPSLLEQPLLVGEMRT